nr:hypothetical protein [uncultured Desulfobacter sp.]
MMIIDPDFQKQIAYLDLASIKTSHDSVLWAILLIIYGFRQ